MEHITLPGVDGGPPVLFEKAGPRERIFFDPAGTRAAMVTCGGLSPGLNNVLRSIFLELHYHYGVPEVLGIRYGYAGLDPANGHEPVIFTKDFVHGIHNKGGTVLGTSRGPVDPGVALDFLASRGINILFCIGGDGTQRGAHRLHEEAQRRGYPLAVVGVPKTIDNDIDFVWRTFGYSTAVEESAHIIDSAHAEAKSVLNGVGLVKLMGREAGFLACGATLASSEVNFTLIPEVPFALQGENGFLEHLKRRLLLRRHAVVVLAEGAGQDLVAGSHEIDKSGNLKLKDSGRELRRIIQEYFAAENIPVDVKYFDPSYIVRSRPANKDDALLCDQFARCAVHAAMAGRTDVLIGLWYNMFVHVSIPMATAQKRRVNPASEVWSAVLSSTGQPAQMGQ
ncbi:MAG: ATP-dependent 6-phosphofructokinase [Bryobacteraceae bacterium]